MKILALCSLVLCATLAVADDIAPNQGTLYSGIWVSGTDANYYEVGLTLQELKDHATTRHGQGLRLIDIETYMEGNQRVWAGVWRSGNDANYYTTDLSLDELKTLAETRHKQ